MKGPPACRALPRRSLVPTLQLGGGAERSRRRGVTGRIASVDQAWKTFCARGLAGESGRPAPQRPRRTEDWAGCGRKGASRRVRSRPPPCAKAGRPDGSEPPRRQRTRAVVPRRRTLRSAAFLASSGSPPFGSCNKSLSPTLRKYHPPLSKENTICSLQAAGSGGGARHLHRPARAEPSSGHERRRREKICPRRICGCRSSNRVGAMIVIFLACSTHHLIIRMVRFRSLPTAYYLDLALPSPQGRTPTPVRRTRAGFFCSSFFHFF